MNLVPVLLVITCAGADGSEAVKGGASKETAPRVALGSAPGAPGRLLRSAVWGPVSTDWVIIENDVKRLIMRWKKFDCLGVLAVPVVGEVPCAPGTFAAAPRTTPTDAGSPVACAAAALAALSAFFCDLDRFLCEVARLLALPAAPGTGGTGVGGTASHCCAAIACCCRAARLAIASSHIFLL